MPFIDLNNHKVLKGNFDITIIGAGAAGILLAVKLTRAGQKVCIIESGHFEYDSTKQSLNKVVNTGKVLSTAVEGRVRAIGGTTITWGGQSLPFSKLDFSERPWLSGSGWPINYEEVAKYYNEANDFMGIDTLNYKDDIFKKIHVEDPGFDSDKIDFHISKWAPIPDFKKLYHSFLEKWVTVFYNAHLIQINKNSQSQVESIKISNFTSESYFIPVKKLIIAAGGIESVRILLENNLGNEYRLVGKGFMEHPCIKIGWANTPNPYKLQSIFNTHLWKKRKYSLRLSLSESFQKKEQTLNCSASLMFLPAADTFDPYGELKAFMKNFKVSNLIRASKGFTSITKSIYALVRHQFFYKANAEISLVLMAEQESISESYIDLSNEVDQFGLKKVEVHWDIKQNTWQTVVKTSAILKAELERLELAAVNIYPAITMNNPDWKNSLSDVNHHMGGAKMSATKNEGVVNKNLQVWDTPNLFVCSSAVFPSASHSNPTLTILALGCRLANHLTGVDEI